MAQDVLLCLSGMALMPVPRSNITNSVIAATVCVKSMNDSIVLLLDDFYLDYLFSYAILKS